MNVLGKRTMWRVVVRDMEMVLSFFFLFLLYPVFLSSLAGVFVLGVLYEIGW